MLAPGKGRGGPCCTSGQGALLHAVGSLAVSPTSGLGKRAYIVVFERPAILSRGGGSGSGEKCPVPNSE